MNKKVYIGYFLEYNGKLIFEKPFEITKDTTCFYYGNRHRYRKDEEGKVRGLSVSHYPYLEVYFIDVENPEQKIKETFSDYYKRLGERILEKRGVHNG